MPNNVYEPFDADVETHGGYQYTDPSRKSSVYANRHFTDIIIAATQPDGRRVVDVGCGDGAYTAVLRTETRADYILGIDPASRAIDRARERCATDPAGLEFRHGFAADLVEQGEHFDLAIYRGVIHHVGDPAGEIATALGLADAVFFLEPNGWNPVVKLIECGSGYHRRHRERSYRLGQYYHWIEAAGGRVKESMFFGLVPMFCPDWFVSLGSFLEPAIERVPLARAICCGQVGIFATANPVL